jgi:hypothetical protein
MVHQDYPTSSTMEPRRKRNELDMMCDNTLAQMLSFLDFESAALLTLMTAKSLSQRMLDTPAYQHVWRTIFIRHGFAPPEETVDFIAACQERRQLFQTLSGSTSHKTCFNLPNRHFFFVPVVPPPDDHDDDDDESWDFLVAPPVDFDCSSYALISPGVSAEMVFLDPFDGSLTIQGSCTQHAVSSDEFMMEQAMMDASELIQHSKHMGWDLGDDEDIAGEIISESVYRNHNVEHYTEQPTQVLVDMEDYHRTDLRDFFVIARDGDRHSRGGEPESVVRENDEVEIDFIGVDCKPIVGNDYAIRGTMVTVGRSLISDPEDLGASKVCTEMIAWKRTGTVGKFDERFVCRFRTYFKSLESCSQFNRLYVVCPFGEGPFRHFDAEIRSDATDRADFDGGGRVVACYPFLDYPEEDDDANSVKTGPKYFPKPSFILRCNHSVSCIVVDPSGETILVGTMDGTIECWKMQATPGAARQYVLNVRELMNKAIISQESFLSVSLEQSSMASLRSEASQGSVDPSRQEHLIAPTFADDEVSAVANINIVEDDEGEINASSVPNVITSIHHPSHLSLENSGFVTLHYKHRESCTLLLWKSLPNSNGTVSLCSTIKLPCCARRKPCIHYDGRRLVVLGQDRVGMIVLVYHVLTTWEDADLFETPTEDDGIENWTQPGRTKFVNRIRHAGMGGLAYHDNVYMSCNERFLVMNTKTGNLLGGGSTPTTDGLLVIDLLDTRRHCT